VITTRRAPRTRRLLIAGFALSVVIHLFGGALWAHGSHVIARIMRRLPEQHAREQEIATSDVVHLERRTIPRPARASRARPAQAGRQPNPMPRREPAPVVRARLPELAASPSPLRAPEIAHRAPHAPPQPRVASAGIPKTHAPKPHAPKPRAAKLGAAKANAAPPGASRPDVAKPEARNALSAAQLAQLNAQFAQTIAASHLDLATIQKQTEERPVATKRYPMQFAGMQANLQRGEGYIEPTTMGQRIGGTVWYYTHYTYMWPDGHLEDDDIPWPFRYPVQRDLFALHIHLIPLQLPPPGFQLTRPIKPFLAHFLLTAGRG
jgi:hypothetical protein